nr:hypothetical protein [Tanacetum cinerariifolium]
MDSIILLGQKNTLAEYVILSGPDNRPPMLDKDLYDSWKSQMELYMQNREHRRMMLESAANGPRIWPTVEENRVIRTKKFAELSAAKKIQAECDMKATNIILQGDDPIACLNKVMAFLTVVASLRGDKGKVILVLVIRVMLLVLGETMQVDRKGLSNSPTIKTEDLDTYDSNCDDILNAKAVFMANISNYGFDFISEVPHSKTYLNDMENQVTTELERYKERVKTFEQRINIDLSSREKMIDSQMDDMIKEKLTLKELVDSLEQKLSKQIKEKECLLQTFTAFKRGFKEKEDKVIENEIDLEKKIKELDNIVFKVG